MPMNLSFILVENAELDRYIAAKLIRNLAGDARVEIFGSARAALDHITANSQSEADPAIILLDLMMPKMSGADFIHQFETLPENIRSRYRIAIVTSSMNKAEMQRLSKHDKVLVAIEKPLTHEKFAAFLAQIDGGFSSSED
ncbi:MAG: response regulator [Bacteroidetes bacterium]|nr:response regulator [Bacteroidota bacterium]